MDSVLGVPLPGRWQVVNQKKRSIEDLMLNLLHVVNIGLMCTFPSI